MKLNPPSVEKKLRLTIVSLLDFSTKKMRLLHVNVAGGDWLFFNSSRNEESRSTKSCRSCQKVKGYNRIHSLKIILALSFVKSEFRIDSRGILSRRSLGEDGSPATGRTTPGHHSNFPIPNSIFPFPFPHSHFRIPPTFPPSQLPTFSSSHLLTFPPSCFPAFRILPPSVCFAPCPLRYAFFSNFRILAAT